MTFRRLILTLPLLLFTFVNTPEAAAAAVAPRAAADCQTVQDYLDSLNAQAEALQQDLAKATSAQKPAILKKIKDVLKKIGIAEAMLAGCQASLPPQAQPAAVSPARILDTDTVNPVPSNIDFNDQNWAKNYVQSERFMSPLNDTTKFEWVPIPNAEVEYDDSVPGPSTPAECVELEAQLDSLNNEIQGLQEDMHGASTVEKGKALKKIGEMEKKIQKVQADFYQCLADHPIVVPRQNSTYGLSGWAVNPQISSADVPFSHPFLPQDPMREGFDWEFMVAPDAPYYRLLGASNKTGGEKHEGEFKEAAEAAEKMGIRVPGVLGVETDQNLVPGRFRARNGDRVAVFGRWVVDAGHADFHTEIHPPLLLVSARQSGPRPEMSTYSTIVGRPFLVGQRFLGDNEPLRAHILNEAKKVYTFRSLKIEAHPVVYTKPFVGDLDFDYVVRPTTPRKSQSDVMSVKYHFTTRTGVSVSLADEGGEGVRVRVSMRSSQYKPAPLPPRRDHVYSVTDILKLDKDAGVATSGIVAFTFGTSSMPGIFGGAAILSRGFTTTLYDAPLALSPTDGFVTTRTLSNLGQAVFHVDDNQPFPIYGWIEVSWDEPKR